MTFVTGTNSLLDWVYVRGTPTREGSVRIRVANGVLEGENLTNGLWCRDYDSRSSLVDIVDVESLSDFPTPVSNVITLSDGVLYRVNGMLDASPNRFVMDGADAIVGRSHTHDGITTTNTGAMFTVTSGGILRITDLTLSGSGSLVSITDPRVGVSFFENCQVDDFPSGLGTITNPNIFFLGSVIFSNITGGFSFVAADAPTPQAPLLIANAISATVATGTFLALGTAKFADVTIIDCPVINVASGATGISGAASSANFVNGIGTVRDNVFSGAGTFLSGITASDVRWVFRDNLGIDDTRVDAEVYISASAETTISTINTPVLVAGTYSEVDANHFTTTAAGRITYIGIQPIEIMITIGVNAQMASGGSNTCGFYIAKDGTPLPSSEIHNDLASNTSSATYVQAITAAVTGTYIEPFIENEAGTINITANKLNMVVHKL